MIEAGRVTETVSLPAQCYLTKSLIHDREHEMIRVRPILQHAEEPGEAGKEDK